MGKKEQGLTLLEVAIAMAILAIGILSLMTVIGSVGSVSQFGRDYNLAYRAASSALDHLKSYEAFENLYIDFHTFQSDYVSPDRGPFAVLENGQVVWQVINPEAPPADLGGVAVVGYGWLEFVTNEFRYPTLEWGTATACTQVYPGKESLRTDDGDGVWDMVDLDADGYASEEAVTQGRTAGTPADAVGLYALLPVKVTIRIFNSDIEVVKRDWIVRGKW